MILETVHIFTKLLMNMEEQEESTEEIIYCCVCRYAISPEGMCVYCEAQATNRRRLEGLSPPMETLNYQNEDEPLVPYQEEKEIKVRIIQMEKIVAKRMDRQEPEEFRFGRK